jgi:protein gp37
MTRRLKAMGQPNYRHGFRVAEHPHTLDLPASWRKPQMIFVNSMSDLFHDEVSTEFIQRVFNVMGRADWHTYQVLTKRAERLAELAPALPWRPNIWMGVTVENADCAYRIDHLRTTSAAVKFLSLEPLLGPLPNLNLQGIDWAVVGGESGPGARPVKPEWITDLRDQCVKAGVAFFFKQWGGMRKKLAGRLLEGRTWDEMPTLAGGCK